MSNCWLLLLSPRVKELTDDAGLSSSKVLVIAVIVEVREDFGTALKNSLSKNENRKHKFKKEQSWNLVVM